MKKNAIVSVFLSALLLLPGCTSSERRQSQDTKPDFPHKAEGEKKDTEHPGKERFTAKDLDPSLPENITDIDLSSQSVSLCLTNAGNYRLSGKMNGTVEINAKKTDKITLILSDAAIDGGSAPAIRVLSADKVFLLLEDGSENLLSGIKEEAGNAEDGVVFSKEDLTVKGSGKVTISGKAGHGIVCKDDLRITGGVLIIEAEKHGIDANDSVSVCGGTVNVNSGKDGVHVENAENTASGYYYQNGGSLYLTSKSDGIEASGSVSVLDGELTVSAGDDGIHSDADIAVSGGTLTLTECHEGLEGNTITISGGEITIRAEDDGINASDGSSGPFLPGDYFGRGVPPGARSDKCVIRISGGITIINADGDGVDSNGKFEMSGGELYISGPLSNANAALDYETGAEITGGILIAAGSAGMAENVTSASQGSALVFVSGCGNLVLTGADGKELASFTPAKAYQSILISCPEMSTGGTYTLSTPSEKVNISMAELIYGNRMNSPGGPGGPGRPGPGGRK